MTSRSALCAAGLILTFAATPIARAQDAMTLEDIAVLLSSGTPDEVKAAIEGAALSGQPEAAALVGERIRAGLPAELLLAAVDAITLLGSPEAGPALVELTSHRRPEVRAKAVEALTVTRSPGADKALAAALADSSSAVRDAAATGLGELGAISAIEQLFIAFERGVPTAAQAIGRLASSNELERAFGYLGKVPFPTLTPMLEALLARKNLTEADKLKVIGRVEDLATAEARGFLEALTENAPEGTPSRVKRAARDAALRIAK